ncbi:MAG TPA: hypothetical protein VHA77_11435 [Xanthobacteraceae bacterium]|nr:hypothetical protein [Xanthobacteraceae bacterium]
MGAWSKVYRVSHDGAKTVNVSPHSKARVYQPERLVVLSKAFEESWTLMRAHATGPMLDREAEGLRRTLALVLFDLYDRGLRDPGRLRDGALDRLGFWSRSGVHAAPG